MENPTIYDVSERPRYKFKKYHYVSMEYDPLEAFSKVSHNVLHVEDVRAYIYYKFQNIRNNEIHKDLDPVCNGDISLKKEFSYLNDLNIIKYMFHMEFENQKW